MNTYRNVKTGAVITVPNIIRGDNWVPVEESSTPAKPQTKKLAAKGRQK